MGSASPGLTREVSESLPGATKVVGAPSLRVLRRQHEIAHALEPLADRREDLLRVGNGTFRQSCERPVAPVEAADGPFSAEATSRASRLSIVEPRILSAAKPNATAKAA